MCEGVGVCVCLGECAESQDSQKRTLTLHYSLTVNGIFFLKDRCQLLEGKKFTDLGGGSKYSEFLNWDKNLPFLCGLCTAMTMHRRLVY